ncbi:MAG: chorismate synthase [Clostridia bacterium]|nr:chorismate synthase [Clostridia bacterium]
MSSIYAGSLQLSLFGQSHGEAIGMTLDGFPAGMQIDTEALRAEMNRRRPGTSRVTTARQEDDRVEFLSGVLNGRTTGQPICGVIYNHGQHSKDYGDGVDVIRPSHADYTGHVRYFGFEDWRGGGSFSGRLTAPIVAAGSLCRQYLRSQGVEILGHILSIGKVQDESFQACFREMQDWDNWKEGIRAPEGEALPTISGVSDSMREEIYRAAAEQDSVGGQVECLVHGLPAGLGAPFFDSVESTLARLLFSVPGVKGVSFGDGFGLSWMLGSEANDAFALIEKQVVTQTNHAGGINGGITNGMPVTVRCALRPTPSIGKAQGSVSLSRMEEEELTIRGRHDPCIVPRALPVVEAMVAIGIMDLWKERAACLT